MTVARNTLLVDDHPVVRKGLAALLQGQQWAGEVRQAATVAEAVVAVHDLAPTLAIVDLRLPDGDGIDVLRTLTARAPGCRSLVLSMNADRRTAEQARQAGAVGYIVKDSDPEQLVESIRTVALGGVLQAMPGEPVQPIGSANPFLGLTPREQHIARLVASGAGNRDIAAQLGITEKTVRNQVSSLRDKVGATSRVALALLATQHLTATNDQGASS